MNPGDLDWAPLEALGELTVHDRTAPAELLERAAGAAALLTNKCVLDRAAIEALPELRYIGVTATGTNVVDLAAAAERGVAVTNVPDYGTESVAQAVFAHILNLANRTAGHAAAVRDGRWTASPDFCFWDGTLVELAGRTLGVVGFGKTGRAVARIAGAFGMEVLAASRRPVEASAGVRPATVDEVFAASDVVSLHCPLTPETAGLVSRERLATMKPTAWLVNTGRGPLVDEAALADTLNAGQLAGAGLDVLSTEPPPADNPLLSAKNCYVTPHIAWATTAARRRLLDCVVGNLAAWQAGVVRNVVG
ncbi:MAG: D-2-hydroxyacid dehydrogenase [Planctomycetota bacterium]